MASMPRPQAILASIGLAAAATLASAFAAVPVAEAVQALVPAFILVLALAGALHAAAGFLAPRPGWAMATPGPVLVAWLTWAMWQDLNARPGDGVEATGGPSLTILFAVVSVGFGMVFAGCILLGALVRRDRDAKRTPAAAVAGPPYP
jgi:hypothetical protein